MADGTTTVNTTSGTAGSSIGAAGGTSTSTLAPWIAPYITDYMSKGQALANQPYYLYPGALTAGASGLQGQAFQGIGSLTVPQGFSDAAAAAGSATTGMGNANYSAVGSDFTTPYAQQYMNPYLQTALNPQIDEARRQAEISRLQNAGRMTKTGAYGGGRQAVMESELQRNMAQNMANITGQGYLNAYEQARQQFNEDQKRKIGEAQFGADYRLRGLGGQLQGAQTQGQLAQSENEALNNLYKMQLAAGQTQRDIEQEGLTADWQEFQRQLEYPYKQLQFQQSLISGLPVGSVTNAANPMSDMGSITSILGALGLLNKGSGGIADLFKS
jgi:hypothetical protein